MSSLATSTTELCLSSMERITDDGLRHLTRLPELQKLWLDDLEGITDSGLAHVGQIIGLTFLSICTESLTDKGVAHLHALKSLKCLHYDQPRFSGIGITNSALHKLKTAVSGLMSYRRR